MKDMQSIKYRRAVSLLANYWGNGRADLAAEALEKQGVVANTVYQFLQRLGWRWEAGAWSLHNPAWLINMQARVGRLLSEEDATISESANTPYNTPRTHQDGPGATKVSNR